MNASPVVLHTLSKRPRHERGAALLTAMIIVTLVVTLAAAMVWQQWRAVQVEAAERARMQSAWILTGALDWARLILREDARSGRPTALTEPWATPLAEARLSTFLALDKSNADEGPDAFLSGAIVDAQSRLNLISLVDQGQVSIPDLEAFNRLCLNIGVSPEVATRIAEGLRDATVPSTTPNADAPLRPRLLSQLTWLGVDTDSINRMAPYVTLLPIRTTVNINTAPREVLAAVIKGIDLSTAERLMQIRQRGPFKDLLAIEAQLPNLGSLNPQQIGVKSTFFEVRGRLRLDDRMLEQRSLIERRGLEKVELQREHLSSREAAGP